MNRDREEAIKTLEQKECDSISRKDALDGILKLKNHHRYAGKVRSDWVDGVMDVHTFLRSLPSVMPQQKVGHWILLDECSNSGYYCSECLKKVVKEGWSNTVKKIKFCPNCGCRMMEVENG